MNAASFLALLPILTLLVVSLWKGVRPAVFSGFGLTAVLFFGMDGEGAAFGASIVSAGVQTVSILMIIFGALFLYQVMEDHGFIDRIKETFLQIHPDRHVRLFFLAIFLTAFFESVAGFGTPGAIVPLLLIGLGFSPVLSIAVVLLLNGFFAVSGAVGVPVRDGLQAPLGLSLEQVSSIYGVAAIGVLLAGVVVIAFLYRYLQAESDQPVSKWGWVLSGLTLVTYALMAPFTQELTGIIAASVMGLFAYFFVFEDRRLDIRPWLPYIALVILLMLPKLLAPLSDALRWELGLSNLFGTSISTSLRPLQSPLIPFLLAGGGALLMAKSKTVRVGPVLSKTFAVFLILFPSLAITQLMIHSGGGDGSMIDSIAGIFATTGNAFPVLSPFLGAIGAFITGSTTVSNMIFGPVQMASAQQLGLADTVILGQQLAGASLGNAVCLFNIVAAGAIAGVLDFRAVLRKTLIPTMVAAGIVGIMGILWLAMFTG